MPSPRKGVSGASKKAGKQAAITVEIQPLCQSSTSYVWIVRNAEAEELLRDLAPSESAAEARATAWREAYESSEV